MPLLLGLRGASVKGPVEVGAEKPIRRMHIQFFCLRLPRGSSCSLFISQTATTLDGYLRHKDMLAEVCKQFDCQSAEYTGERAPCVAAVIAAAACWLGFGAPTGEGPWWVVVVL